MPTPSLRPLTGLALAAGLALGSSSGLLAAGSGPQLAPLRSGLRTPRIEAATVWLPDRGEVLIVGGKAGNAQPLASAESFRDGAFTPLAKGLSRPRYDLTATRLQDGTVLCAGGRTSIWSPLAVAERYHPDTGAFTPLFKDKSKPAMNVARSAHTATLLKDGQVLLAGGLDNQGAVDSAELYDPATDTFTLLKARMTTPRDGASATLLEDGDVLFIGGSNRSQNLPQNTAELYHPDSRTFTRVKGTMPVARTQHAAILLDPDTVLVTGGISGSKSQTDYNDNTTWVDTYPDDEVLFHVKAQTFEKVPGKPGRHWVGHAAVALGGRRALLLGGAARGDAVELYDGAAKGNPFSQIKLGKALPAACSVTPMDGQVLVAGGLADTATPSPVGDAAILALGPRLAKGKGVRR